MKMGVKVYYSEINGQKEVKKRQQRVMMILDSKAIPYEPIDITEPGKEQAKDFVLKNAKAKEGKSVQSPQIFNEEEYCGDYDDFDLANENDELEEFLKCPRTNSKKNSVAKVENGTAGSREGSAEVTTNDVPPPKTEESTGISNEAEPVQAEEEEGGEKEEEEADE